MKTKKRPLRRFLRKNSLFITTLFIILLIIVVAYDIRQLIIEKYNQRYFQNKPLEVIIPMKYHFDMINGLNTTLIQGATIYSYNNHPNQTDDTPNRTGSGRMVCEGIVAVSQDLLKKDVFMGDVIYIKKYKKYFVVEDTMNERYKKSFDIFLFDEKASYKMGITRSDVVVLRIRK